MRIKTLEKKMTYSEAKKYTDNSDKWNMLCRDSVSLVDEVNTQWAFIDETKEYLKGEDGFHPIFPNQRYPTVFRIADGKTIFNEGSPHVLYKVVVSDQ